MHTSARVAVLTLMLAVAVLLIALAQPASAHVLAPETAAGTTSSVEIPITATPVAPPVPTVPAPPTRAPLWPAVVLAATALLGALTPRRALVFALVLALTVSAAETAVHSVHHLTDQQASPCVAASVSAHVHGAALDPPVEPLLSLPARAAAVVAIDSGLPGSRSVRPDEGRAPPA
jgi:hypothetical protein